MPNFRNTNREAAVTVRSADGDAAVIPAGATVMLAEKFNWRLPKTVRVKQDAITAQPTDNNSNGNVGLSANASPGSGVTVTDA